MAKDTTPTVDGFLWLDVNTAGAWKHVIRFPAFNRSLVQAQALGLASLATSLVTFRLAIDHGTVIAYCAPDKIRMGSAHRWRDA